MRRKSCPSSHHRRGPNDESVAKMQFRTQQGTGLRLGVLVGVFVIPACKTESEFVGRPTATANRDYSEFTWGSQTGKAGERLSTTAARRLSFPCNLSLVAILTDVEKTQGVNCCASNQLFLRLCPSPGLSRPSSALPMPIMSPLLPLSGFSMSHVGRLSK